MQLGLDVAQHQLEWGEILDRVRYAEAAGFTGAWVFDHFEALYGDPGGPCLEGWTLLSALAAHTERIRLGTLVTGMTYRHPSVLAAQAITVDHVSGGRLELAVGAAWNEHEHRALGIEFPSMRERAERLEEGVQVLRLLMSEDEASFQGKHYSLERASLHPRPVQRPHPPIWIGARGERKTIPIVARHANVWHGDGSVEELRRKSELLDRLAEEAGRDPTEIRRASTLSISEDWSEVRRTADALREIGFDYLVVGWPTEGRGRLEEFVEQVMPELR